MRLDAEEILRLVLARLDDMKAEDILTIDLRDKSSIGDYMVVSAQSRHCGPRRRRAAMRLGVDRRR